jgi:hypothetical protein
VILNSLIVASSVRSNDAHPFARYSSDLRTFRRAGSRSKLFETRLIIGVRRNTFGAISQFLHGHAFAIASFARSPKPSFIRSGRASMVFLRRVPSCVMRRGGEDIGV